jgi:crotonobetainyl-CoA:carnitine CoA-transferase CaiB-like acyl-CoA transferase
MTPGRWWPSGWADAAFTGGAAAVKKLPLDGVRVLDLTMMWAGPFATMRLAEMGAEVWKVESPTAWDNIRTLLPQAGVADPWNSSYYFNAYNRQKKSVTLDLARDEGRRLFLRLVDHVDVLIENYRADVLDKLGLGWDVLRATKPELVIVSMAAFGKSGPDAGLVGFGPVIEMMSGLVSLSGYGDGEPFKTGISYGDPVAGHQAVAAAVLGLIRRRRTGEGCAIDMAQRETGSVMAGEAFVAASLRGEEPTHWGNRSPRFVPQGCYRAADSAVEPDVGGDEQWLVISCRSDREWRCLAEVVGRADLAGLGRAERMERHDELDEVIGAWVRRQDAQVAMERLQAEGVPAGRVLDTGSALDDPHLQRRGFWIYLPHPQMHRYKQFATPWRFVEANPRLRRHSPLFGEHNQEVLGGGLGLSDDELADLAARGVIGDAPRNPSVG